MTPDKKQEIARLAAEMHDKKICYEASSLQNTFGLNVEDATERAAAHALAQAEYYEACTALRNAMAPEDDVVAAERILADIRRQQQIDAQNQSFFYQPRQPGTY